MKITQTNNVLIIKKGAASQIFGGIIFVVIGIATAALFSLGLVSEQNGEKAPMWVSLFGLVFVIIGFLLLVFASKTKISFEKGGQTSIEKKRVIGGKSSHQAFPTQRIVAVELNTQTATDNNTTDHDGFSNQSSRRESELSVILDDNVQVHIDKSSGNSGVFSVNGLNITQMFRSAPLSKEAQQLAAFLNVPLRNTGEATFKEAVGAIRDMFTGNNPNGTPQQTTAPNPGAQPSAQVPPSPQPSPPVIAPQAPVPPVSPSQQNNPSQNPRMPL